MMLNICLSNEFVAVAQQEIRYSSCASTEIFPVMFMAVAWFYMFDFLTLKTLLVLWYSFLCEKLGSAFHNPNTRTKILTSNILLYEHGKF